MICLAADGKSVTSATQGGEGKTLAKHQQQRAKVYFLAIEGTISGRVLPLWKAAVDARQRLGAILLHWARLHIARDVKEVPPEVLVSFGGAGTTKSCTAGPTDFACRVRDLVSKPTQGRFTIRVFWPHSSLPDKRKRKSATAAAKSKLMKLHPSTKYCNIDGEAMQYHRSSTYKAKLASGAYAATSGLHNESEYAAAMRSPAAQPGQDSQGRLGERQMRELVVWLDEGFTKELLRVRLCGPASLLANWAATCEKFEVLRKAGRAIQEKETPFPIFIPTCGRAEHANLNWEAAHVLGQPTALEVKAALRPVVIAVVEPDELQCYAERWPDLLFLVLPRSGQGPGYARWVLQKVCTRAYVAEQESRDWRLRRLPWIWVCDDSITMFYKLVPLPGRWLSRRHGVVQRRKQREAGHGPMFREAMLAVQRHPFLQRAAVTGFLRDDGTAVCKRLDWKSDEMALYKVVLLNLGKLRSLGVEYLPHLRLYEDICLNNEVLRKRNQGGHTLKCQSFCYRAVHFGRGGCDEQRDGGQRKRVRNQHTTLDCLVAPERFAKLSAKRQEVVNDVLRWAQAKEQQCRAATTACHGSAAGECPQRPPKRMHRHG